MVQWYSARRQLGHAAVKNGIGKPDMYITVAVTMARGLERAFTHEDLRKRCRPEMARKPWQFVGKLGCDAEGWGCLFVNGTTEFPKGMPSGERRVIFRTQGGMRSRTAHMIRAARPGFQPGSWKPSSWPSRERAR